MHFHKIWYAPHQPLHQKILILHLKYTISENEYNIRYNEKEDKIIVEIIWYNCKSYI